MLLPDVNVLIYAHRRDEACHEAYRDWMHRLVTSDEPFGLSVLAAVGFVRIVTNRRIYAEPTPLPVALAAIDALAAREGCRLVGPGPAHWRLVHKLCTASSATAKLVADAAHAAVAIEHGCEWVSRDADFEKFVPAGLRFTLLRL